MHKHMRLLSLILLLVSTPSCATWFEQSSLKSISDDIKDNAATTTLYNDRVQIFADRFYAPTYGGNIAQEIDPGLIIFADQTVYTGLYISWQAARLYDPATRSDAMTRIQTSVDFVLSQLVIPTTLPNSTAVNTGYFQRDSATMNTVTIDGQVYNVQSDAKNGTDDQMSQDQVIHLLRGYYLAYRALNTILDPNKDALLQKIRNHANDIGTRLKAYNYIILAPDGTQVKRGADARGFAWPIAQTIALITGQPLSNYLETVDIDYKDKTVAKFSAQQMKDLFRDTIDAVTLGVCDIKIGDDHHDICQRFTVALINNLYVSSGYYNEVKAYVTRLDKDGDYLNGALSRLFLKHNRLPDAYLDALTSANSSSFTSTSGPDLWCFDDRWVRLTSPCPNKSGGSLEQYNALDFMALYDTLGNAGYMK